MGHPPRAGPLGDVPGAFRLVPVQLLDPVCREDAMTVSALEEWPPDEGASASRASRCRNSVTRTARDARARPWQVLALAGSRLGMARYAGRLAAGQVWTGSPVSAHWR